MNDHNVTFFRHIDQICGRMNSGLAAVAVVLGVMVVCIGAIRAAEMATDVRVAAAAANPSAGFSTFNAWTCY